MSTTTTKRLWEVDHPYYCSESNYYVGGVPKELRPQPNLAAMEAIGIDPWENFTPYDHVEFESWADFGWKDSDEDMNLLFRWDWDVPDADDFEAGEMPEERLNLFWMLQRKGRFMVTSFPVKREDEPEIREWLQHRFEHLLKLWTPFSAPTGEPSSDE